jgi:hypothetical protein
MTQERSLRVLYTVAIFLLGIGLTAFGQARKLSASEAKDLSGERWSKRSHQIRVALPTASRRCLFTHIENKMLFTPDLLADISPNCNFPRELCGERRDFTTPDGGRKCYENSAAYVPWGF